MINFWLIFLTLVVLGVLAASNIIISKRPDAKDVLDKLALHQGWIGVAGAVLGIIVVIKSLLNLEILQFVPLLWITSLACGLIMTLLGFLLGYSLISKYLLSRNEAAEDKAEEIRLKLAGKQSLFGLISLGLAAWLLIVRYVIYSI